MIFIVLEIRTAFLYLNVGIDQGKEECETFAYLEGYSHL